MDKTVVRYDGCGEENSALVRVPVIRSWFDEERKRKEEETTGKEGVIHKFKFCKICQSR